MRKRIVAIGDTHFPFQCNATLGRIYSLVESYKPHVIIQLGDLYDFYSASAFPRSHNIMTPREEVEEARQGAEAFWKNIRKAAPRATYFQLWGNHDVRPRKRVMEMVPALESFFKVEDMFRFPSVETLQNDRDDLEVDGVIFEHGHKKFGAHMRDNLAPTVCGHSHLGGLLMSKVRGRVIWELNAGYVGDPQQEAFAYGHKKWDRWTRGVATIDPELGPSFVLLEPSCTSIVKKL